MPKIPATRARSFYGSASSHVGRQEVRDSEGSSNEEEEEEGTFTEDFTTPTKFESKEVPVYGPYSLTDERNIINAFVRKVSLARGGKFMSCADFVRKRRSNPGQSPGEFCCHILPGTQVVAVKRYGRI
jgi:hypothetical protein